MEANINSQFKLLLDHVSEISGTISRRLKNKKISFGNSFSVHSTSRPLRMIRWANPTVSRTDPSSDFNLADLRLTSEEKSQAASQKKKTFWQERRQKNDAMIEVSNAHFAFYVELSCLKLFLFWWSQQRWHWLYLIWLFGLRGIK
jgi:hypothetical protein